MTSKLKLLVAAGAISAAMLNASSAYAAGTAQGTSINNSVNITYQVGGVAQTPPPAATNAFVVDRKVIFSLNEAADAATTTVNPGQVGAITTFVLSNTSNDLLDFSIAATQIVGGTAAHGGTDNFNVTNVLICRDGTATVLPNGACDAPATATLTINDLAADGNTNILVLADTPVATADLSVAGITLTATALKSDGSSFVSGVDYGDSVVNNPTTVQTVFADVAKSGNGGTSAARDGIDVATDDYTVVSARLSVFKSSRVVSDPITPTGGTNVPKAIPGAIVEYCISVANATGGATATNINISDNVPTNTVIVNGSILLNASVTSPGAGQTCTGGTAGGTYTEGPPANVSGTLNNITGGNSSALIFRVTIQ